jgi:hypothetical protein
MSQCSQRKLESVKTSGGELHFGYTNRIEDSPEGFRKPIAPWHQIVFATT